MKIPRQLAIKLFSDLGVCLGDLGASAVAFCSVLPIRRTW
jgi:hypothetical protein